MRVKRFEMVNFRLAEMWGDEDLFHGPSNQSSYRKSRLMPMQLEADMKQLCCWYPFCICDHINLSFAPQRRYAVLQLPRHCRCLGKQWSHVHFVYSMCNLSFSFSSIQGLNSYKDKGQIRYTGVQCCLELKINKGKRLST